MTRTGAAGAIGVLVVALVWPAGDAIAQAATQRFPRPAPRFEVKLDRSVWIPMRDGVRLSTDFYWPQGVPDTLPTVLIRTPYNKNRYRIDGSVARWWASQGYVVATQDTRGRWESGGEYVIQGHDDVDGYDTVDWLSKQPWSNGKIGTYGCSYVGDVQIMQATLRHPNLTALIPQAAGSSIGSAGGRYRYFGVRNGGAVELAAGLGWFRNNGSKVYYRPPPGTSQETWVAVQDFFNPGPIPPDINYREMWRSLPLLDMVERSGAPPTDWNDLTTRDLTDPWWDQFAYLTPSDRFDVPALHINSWYDFGVTETLLEFNMFRSNAESARGRDNQFAIISPTVHCRSEHSTRNTVVGERDVGDAQFDHFGTYLRWFDFWLKGIQNGVTEMSKLQIYVMGKEEWRGENEWPLARTRYAKYYLHSNGHANSLFGTGALSTTAPGDEPPDRYVYDPETPVPSRGGPICCTGTPDAPEGAFDQSDVEARSDVLVYTTPVLERGIEVTGPIELVLYVSSSARDTDFTGKLVDVYPDGRAFNVQEGILRARYREGLHNKVWMSPGEIYEVKVDMQSTSNYFPAGHRIRLEVSSSNFPRLDRNLNTGGNNYDETEWSIANNVVHHSAEHPSHIVLPVVE